MNKFDFNIENYTKNDLEDMLSLKTPYTNEELFNKVQTVETEVSQVNPEIKEKLNDFMSDVKQKLKKYDDILIEHKNATNENKMNPLQVKTLTKYLHFDSKFRKNYYGTSATDVLFTLPYTINNTVELELHEIEIPDSYYQISSLLGNNYFMIVCQGGTNVPLSEQYLTFEATIPDGNWSIDTFVNYLNDTVFKTDWDIKVNELTDTGNYFKKPSNDQRLVASYLSYSNKITISINDMSNSTYPDLSGIELYFGLPSGTVVNVETGEVPNVTSTLSIREKLGFMMGFKSAAYIGNTAYVGESPANLISSNYFYLVVNDFIGNHIESNIIAYTDSYNSKDIFAKINKNNMTPISASKKDEAVQSPNPLISISRKYLGPVNIRKLKLSVVDDFGRMINLNNLDWSCTLKFTYLYD
tara:strand:+ start:4847 stop:6085 length:1239 start_codon:yes stop_codon:yes gene_type:complete